MLTELELNCSLTTQAVWPCCRRAQTETERAPKLSGRRLLSKPAVTQWTRVQRLSPQNKGGLPYIPFRAGYRNKGYSLSHTWSYAISLAI
jgi:hypothetical protein